MKQNRRRRVATHLRTASFLAALFFCAGCATTGSFFSEKPVQSTPYIIVYGRDNCPACVTVKRELDGAKLGYVYKDMTNEDVRREVRSRMEKAGMNTEKILIPVVDVNGSLAVRPSLRDMKDRYGRPPSEDHKPAAEAFAPVCRGPGPCSSSL